MKQHHLPNGQVLSAQIATCRLLSNHVAPRDSATLRSCSQNVRRSSSQAPNKVAPWLSTNTSINAMLKATGLVCFVCKKILALWLHRNW